MCMSCACGLLRKVEAFIFVAHAELLFGLFEAKKKRRLTKWKGRYKFQQSPRPLFISR